MYIGIGSNIDAETHLRKAATMLRNAFKDIRFSSVYRSAAQEIVDQADFLNAAAVLNTGQKPEDVLTVLQEIEKKLKKNPPKRFGPRTIDLDILLFGDRIALEDTLTLPHLMLHRRRFVLEPLIELGAAEIIHPGFDRTIGSFLPDVEKQDCNKTNIRL